MTAIVFDAGALQHNPLLPVFWTDAEPYMCDGFTGPSALAAQHEPDDMPKATLPLADQPEPDDKPKATMQFDDAAWK